MIKISEFENIINSYEAVDLEFKSAKGGIPGSFWETYSSFANTQGGEVFLGVKQTIDGFTIDGLTKDQIETFKKQLWDCLNNRNKVSVNVLSNNDIEEVETSNGFVLAINIPRADLKVRPVYIDNKPSKVYKREHEGDYICTADEIHRMYAEANILESPQDAKILEGFCFEQDIDKDSFRKYRQVFTNRQPSHPWSSLPDYEFMCMIGGYRKDRKSKQEGLTLAGMLMFGKMTSITDPYCCPAFFPDYREVSSEPNEKWINRVYWDGSWESNLFNFYNKVYNQLIDTLPKPFILKNGIRVDDSPMHIAIREAFVNTLIHCDYTINSSIIIEKHKNKFTFSNPGTLLVTVDQYFKGGESVCRNKALQQMFTLIGSAERAGSGASKIWDGWKQANYRNPYIEQENSKVTLEMPLANILSNEILLALRKKFGNKIDGIEQNKLLTLAACENDGFITNKKLQFILDLHPSDITILLKNLCQDGYLAAYGNRRGTKYELNAINIKDNLVNTNKQRSQSGQLSFEEDLIDQNDNTSMENDNTSMENDNTSMENDNTIKQLVSELGKNKSSKELYCTILTFCSDFKSVNEIASYTNRTPGYLKRMVIPVLIEKKLLYRKYPDKPNHPNQQYKTKKDN